jgi:hypothetical protein
MIPLITPAWTALLGLVKGNRVAAIAIGAVLILGFLQVRSCNRNADLKKQVAVAEHNIQAARDTIRYEKTRDGDTLAVKLAYLTDKIGNLEELNADLYAEVKNIKGKVSTIIKTDVKVVHDTVPLVVNGTLVNNIATANFDYSADFSPGNFRKLKGWTKYNISTGQTSGQLVQDEFGMRFKTGIKNLDKNKPEIFIESDYPGFQVTALEGAVLDPNLFKSSRSPLITLGVGVGWVPATYDFQTNKVDVNLQRIGVSAGVNVNILRLLKPNK